VLVNGDLLAAYMNALKKDLAFPKGVEMKVYVSNLCNGEQRCRFVDAYLNVLKGSICRCAKEREVASEGDGESDEDV
jgi:hypothetical protein